MALQYKKIHLVIMAIEGGAQKLHISGQDMYSRLHKQGLIHNYLIPYYEELHTQSKEWLVDTTVEALKNWEAEE